jgi:hypothetical protein
MEPMTNTIMVFDPPSRFSFIWSGDELHFELEAVGDSGCQLTLINILEARNTAARNAAGWTVCLAELDKLLRGDVADGPHSDTAEPWREHYDAYIADGMPHGADNPGAKTPSDQ